MTTATRRSELRRRRLASEWRGGGPTPARSARWLRVGNLERLDYTSPRSPSAPAAASSQSGLTRVKTASTATTAVMP